MLLRISVSNSIGAAQRASFAEALSPRVEIQGDSRHAVFDWIELIGLVKEYAPLLGGVSASLAIGERIVKWRKGEDSEGRPRDIILRSGGDDTLDLRTATDEEIIEWVRRKLPDEEA